MRQKRSKIIRRGQLMNKLSTRVARDRLRSLLPSQRVHREQSHNPLNSILIRQLRLRRSRLSRLISLLSRSELTKSWVRWILSGSSELAPNTTGTHRLISPRINLRDRTWSSRTHSQWTLDLLRELFLLIQWMMNKESRENQSLRSSMIWSPLEV